MCNEGTKITIEEWISMGRPFMNEWCQRYLDKFLNGEIKLINLFDVICEEYLQYRNTPNVESTNPCYGCENYDCLYSLFYDFSKTEEENIREFCYECPCADGGECNRDSDAPCYNYKLCTASKNIRRIQNNDI